MVRDRQQTESPTTESTLSTGLTTITGITAILVLVQAVLAGRGWFVDADYIDLHEILSNFIFVVVLVQSALAFVAMRRGLATRALLAVSAALVVLVVAQIGLGYGGRDSGEAAALHVPNGVLIFGLSVAGALLARGR